MVRTGPLNCSGYPESQAHSGAMLLWAVAVEEGEKYVDDAFVFGAQAT